jgi:hypothetical protein
MELIAKNFFIPAEKTRFAAAAILLMKPIAFGKKEFKWVHMNFLSFDADLSQVMTAWRYRIKHSHALDIVDIEFITGGEKGDCVHMFSAIAPYVKKGSFLQFEENYVRWGYYFTGGHLVEFQCP